MRTGAYIRTLTDAGLDPKVAQAHGRALESALGEDYVTKDYFDAKLDGRFAQFSSEIRVAMYQAMFVQTVTLIGLTAAMIKLLK